ncbi:MAG: glycosyltransferase family 2 protein [Caulobacteraceae bacterium]|nr:glycosyltransferase family 2 protein [Caulobacteraceae bacterium]
MGGAAVEISAVIPCLNEIENAEGIAAAVGRELQRLCASYEIIFIDNGSTDGTIEAIKAMCASDPRIKLIANNQNYGQLRSPAHGIYQASGAAVIGLCADFQDPPEMIPEFVSRWRKGTKIVMGVRRSEKSSAFLRFIRAVGYGFFARFADYRVIPNATGFGLYDRAVVDALKGWRDPEPFFRGMLVESGFSLETIEFDRPQRAGGKTKNNVWTLVSVALSGLASSSKRLLRAPLMISVVAGCVGALLILAAAIRAAFGAETWSMFYVGLATVAFAVIMFFLGLIGEQVRLLALIARNAPLVIEKERINFPPVEK